MLPCFQERSLPIILVGLLESDASNKVVVWEAALSD